MTRTARRARPATLWSAEARVDPMMLSLTIGGDRRWDSYLLDYDILGSLGHIEGLRRSRLLGPGDYARLRAGLRAALRAARRGALRIGPGHEDAHSAVEDWLTRRLGAAGERVHTGRSRNDQVACDLRLFLKDRLSVLALGLLGAAGSFLIFAEAHRTALWPGYTHTRRGMPSSAGLWAAAHAEGLLDTLEALPALWARLDRSPLGSAAGYGVPLPLDREAVARALGFAAVEHNVAAVQNGRGKLEAEVLFWCAQIGHDLGRFASDAVLWSGEEFGYLVLPPELATGSSIMPQKRNPDLLELVRARAAAVEGQLATVLALRGKLTSGYHRDFQLLKEPLIRGLELAMEMAGSVCLVVPRLGVDRARGLAALESGALATDEAMRRVEEGIPFRRAYREVAEAVKRGGRFPPPAINEILRRRRSTGGLGRLELGLVWRRWTAAERWILREQGRFERAMDRLAGRRRRR